MISFMVYPIAILINLKKVFPLQSVLMYMLHTTVHHELKSVSTCFQRNYYFRFSQTCFSVLVLAFI